MVENQLSAVLTGVVVLGVLAAAQVAAGVALDETPGAPQQEWGFRPAEQAPSLRNPPAFSWRPQDGAAIYTLQIGRDADFGQVVYEAHDLTLNVHCPPAVLEPGEFFWRFRYSNGEGNDSAWSSTRRFTIDDDAVEFALPTLQDLLSRVPDQHPRLFVRPEQMPRLRELAKGELKPIYDNLVKAADRIIADPPSTEEPPIYPEGTVRLSEEWRTIWWGNRLKTIAVLDGAATLGFVYQLSGDERYGQEARRLLMEAARWDPLGATGYRYNDEAGMPYAYFFSRTYTFINDLLSEEEKQICREVMRIRGEEMYNHLHPRHLWRPYGSHSNRAWHFLGEVAIAFKDEIPGADDWLWFAMNVFANAYPVWNDSDGGWHEGLAYWRSYLSRFTWWADIMRAAMEIDAYRLPFFSQAGYFPMYLQPPGTFGGGFGDQAHTLRSDGNVTLMATFAAQAGNPYWQWYVDAHGGHRPAATYVSFIRGALPQVEARAPTDLPASRIFRGTGLAMLNTTLLDAADNVQILFKSSPMGSISHGYDAQNAFMLYAFGERLFLSSGQRDIHGSDHHREWMWHTKSVNSITVGGEGQIKHSPLAVGRITGFHTSDAIDFVSGEAGEAYEELLDGFERSIVFVKPALVVIVDRLSAPSPKPFEWWLHAMEPFEINTQDDIHIVNNTAACAVSFHVPRDLKISQTDQFDPPPRERVQLVQHHLTAQTPEPAERMLFVTSLRPHRSDNDRPPAVTAEEVAGGHVLAADLPDGRAIVLVRNDDADEVAGEGFITAGRLAVIKLDADGQVTAQYAQDGEIRPQ